jgi:hypothetical protein
MATLIVTGARPNKAVPSYSKFHLLFAIQACFCAASNQIEKVPAPSATEKVLNDPDALITMAAGCYNSALDVAISEYQEKNKIFSPQNWLKAKDSIFKVQAAVKMYLGMVGNMPVCALFSFTIGLLPSSAPRPPAGVPRSDRAKVGKRTGVDCSNCSREKG